MTYAEQNGYKIGDRFLTLRGSVFAEDQIVEFYLDDGSTCPKFRTVGDGTECGYEHFDFLEKVNKTPEDYNGTSSVSSGVDTLPELLKGSGLALSINSDGSIAVYDDIRERSCLVGSMGAAITLIRGLVEVEEKINELANWG